MASFTAHTLPIWANWAQALSGITLVTALFVFYAHHRCHHCKRIARYKVGPHQMPTCHRHRFTEANPTEGYS